MGKPRTNPVTDDQIVESYLDTKSVYRVASALGIGSTTVHRVLCARNVKRDGLKIYRKSITRFQGQEHELRRDYDSGMTLKQLSDRYGPASDYSLKHAIKRAGGVLRENPAPLVQDGEIEAIRSLNADGLGQTAISLKIGRSQSFVSRIMRKHGIAAQSNCGPGHSMWRGGRYPTSSGYIRVWVAADDPMVSMCLADHTVLEHRLVMARSLGRPLLRAESIHHINGDKADNRIENLELRQGKHGKNIVMRCLDCGSHNIGPVGLSTNGA